MSKLCYTVLFASLVWGCASGGQNKGTGKARNVITAAEIAASSGQNAYQVIQQLRPQLLTLRGIEPTVYVDNMKRGGLDSLYGVYASDIQEIRYLSPDEATLRFGTGNAGGAFLITTKAN